MVGGPCRFKDCAVRRREENHCNSLFREGSKHGSVLNTNTLLEAAVLRECVQHLHFLGLISPSCAVCNMQRIVVGRPGKSHEGRRQNNKTNIEGILRGKLLPNICCTMWFSRRTGSVALFRCLSP